MSIAIVVLESLAIPFVYEGEEPRQDLWSGEWGSQQIASHVKVPDGLDPVCAMATRDPETGEITLQEDPIKVQAKLDQAWRDLRSQRNARLAETDWVALADAHLSQDKKDAWFAYRQELRDLPELITSPTDLVSVPWPLKPGELPPPPPVTASRLDALLEHAGVVEEVQEPVVEAETVQEPTPVVEEVQEPVVESTEAEPAPEVTEEPVQEA